MRHCRGISSLLWMISGCGWSSFGTIQPVYSSKESDDGTTVSTVSTAAVSANLKLVQDLTDWVNSLDGGYFNPKQEVRPVSSPTNTGHGDDNGGGAVFFGIFAKEFIAKDELLNQVPWEYIVNDDEDEAAPESEEGSILRCGTVRNIVREMKKLMTAEEDGRKEGTTTDGSKYAPYIRYLLNQPKSPIPSAWSDKGRAILKEVLGGTRRVLPPNEVDTWLDEDWYETCDGDEDDEFSANAAMLVVSRADDALMVPIYDMYNHRNGKWYNTKMKWNEKVNHQVVARRDIQPGEQIYNSYNACDECGGRRNGYGTPEILRDYGFVEEFPQRWDLRDEFDVIFDLDKQPDGSIKLTWPVKAPKNRERKQIKQGLLKEVKRLRKVHRLIWEREWKNGTTTVPKDEWETIWEYHQAVVDAISYAHNELTADGEEGLPITEKDGSCSLEVCGDHYDVLDLEPDDLVYNKPTCSNRQIMKFPDYYMLEHLKTNYQVLNFAFRQSNGDICMDLEDTIQICSCYRPHYHEFSAHFAARFLHQVKRIIFVGGGDSMLLHESLKFPNLEKVVGLELDETVTRKSFKYFRTQPHFDDDRVEWWFGDATKSLLLLPKDYWGTFDLVLVDLSETVMAFSVTDDLDVFAALALLLNEDGVMVKNELYMADMSAVFDYTVQIYLAENPKICSQVMSFGSNRADFFHQRAIDHGVKTLMLPSVPNMSDKFEYFHDYRKNSALEQGKCDAINVTVKEEQEKSAGILHVLDAENVEIPLDDGSIETLIRSVAEEHNFTPLSIPVSRTGISNSGFVVVVFKEGYATVRYWSEQKYCAIDIGLWGGFQQAHSFQKQLGVAMKAKTLSSFRVVVGGMYGSSTWKDDRDEIGPVIVQRRNCEDPGHKDTKFSDDYTHRVIVDEVTNLVGSTIVIAGVICGVKDQDECVSLDVLQKSAKVRQVIPIWTCPNLDGGNEDSERIAKMLDCETKTVESIRLSLGRNKLGLFVMDGNTPFAMGQIVNSILMEPKHRTQFLADYNIMMAWSNNPKHETWQRAFLDRYRKEVRVDPIFRSEYKVTVDGELLEVGIVSTGDLSIFHNLNVLEKKLTKRIVREGVPAAVEIVTVNGAVFPFVDDHKATEYLQSDYDSTPADKQYEEQLPLGRETVLQFELDTEKKNVTMLGLDEMTKCLESTLSKLKYNVTRFDSYKDVGDGLMVVTSYKEGSAVLVWDGRNHVDVILFSFDDRKEIADSFASSFVHFAMNKVKVGLRDDFPRGLGRVVNFKDDLDYKGIETFTKRDPYVT